MGVSGSGKEGAHPTRGFHPLHENTGQNPTSGDKAASTKAQLPTQIEEDRFLLLIDAETQRREGAENFAIGSSLCIPSWAAAVRVVLRGSADLPRQNLSYSIRER